MIKDSYLFTVSYNFANGTLHIARVIAAETKNGRYWYNRWPAASSGISKGRLGQYNLIHSMYLVEVRHAVEAVTIFTQDQLMNGGLDTFRRRVEKTQRRLDRQSAAYASTLASNVKTAHVRQPDGSFVATDPLAIKAGDYFFMTYSDGSRSPSGTDRIAKAISNGFVSRFGVKGVIADFEDVV